MIDPDHSLFSFFTNSVTVLLIILNSPRNNLYITGESRLCYRVVVQGQTMNFMSLGQVKDTLENVPIKCLVEKSNLC